MKTKRYIIDKFDRCTWLVLDAKTLSQYCECADAKDGSDAKKRAKRIANALNKKVTR